MHVYDYLGILVALVLALIAGKEARAAVRASVAVYLRQQHQHPHTDWVRTYDLYKVFGSPVYSALQELLDAGVAERAEAPSDSDVRGPYPNVLYRWKGPAT